MRPQGWDKRLNSFIADRRALHFEWGVNDCCVFALEARDAIMATTDAPGLVTWSTALEAARLVDDKTVRGLADQWFGVSLEGWRRARRGDVCLISAERGLSGNDALAVCLGAVVACPGEFELEYAPLKSVRAVWRIE